MFDQVCRNNDANRQWRVLGRHLGLTEAELDCLVPDGTVHSLQDMCSMILEQWSVKYTNPSAERLSIVLRKIGIDYSGSALNDVISRGFL